MMILWQAIVALCGVWLVAVAGLMAFRPERTRDYLAAAGSTDFINIAEHALRMLAGVSFYLAAPVSRFPLGFEVFGAFLVVTSAIILMIPRRWHHGYALFWAKRIPLPAMRLLAPLSAAAGAFVLYAII